MSDNTYQNKIQVLEEEVREWKSKREKVKSDLRILIKKREEMQNTLKSYQDDILKAQHVSPTHDDLYVNKIGDLKEEVRALKIVYKNEKLCVVEVKDQLNTLEEEIQRAKNASANAK